MTKTGVNNLSQQLCELCGIEPKILYKSKSNLSSGTCWKTREEYKNSACNQYWSETENTRYPDFEKPENFVRLFNFKFLESTVAKEMCRIGEFSDTSQFLSLLIESLKDEFYFTSHAINALKQAIASEEWEY